MNELDSRETTRFHVTTSKSIFSAFQVNNGNRIGANEKLSISFSNFTPTRIGTLWLSHKDRGKEDILFKSMIAHHTQTTFTDI